MEKSSTFFPQTGLEKTYLFIIRWGIYLVLFTPLIIHTRFFFPFVTPKTIFFRIVVEIILAAYILLAISNSRYRPKINALTMAIVLFLAIFILASLTGINLERSFWSTYERMTGVLPMLHLLAFFIVLTSVFKTRKDWEKFLGVSIIVGVLLSLYVLMGDEASSRGGGTIGNTSFMAAYLLFDIFFAIILLLSQKGLWRIFPGVSLAIMLPVLFTATARGALISFYGGLFLLGLGYLFFSQKKMLKRAAFGIVLLLMVFSIVSVIFQPPFIQDKIESTAKEMQPRFTVWEKGLKGFQERPILGWGPENFNVVFLKYFNPCVFLDECGGEIWFDRVHNIVFDTLVTTGLIGLLTYLSIFVIAIYGLLKTIPRIVERRNIFIPLGMVVVLAVYFAQNLLVFDMINTYLMFFLSLGFIGFLIQKPTTETERKTRSLNPILAAIIIIVMIFVLWVTNIQPLIANNYIIKMVWSRDAESASLFFQKSLDSWMEKYEPREHFTQKMTKAIYQEIREEDRDAFQKAFELAEIEMEKGVQKNSLDFRPRLFLGQLYNSSFRFSGDQAKAIRAEEILEKAIQLSPTNPQGYWHLAEAKTIQGRIEEAILLLQKAAELEPRIAVSHWYLAMAYKIVEQYELAQQSAIEAQKRGFHWEDELDNLKRVIDIHLALKDDKNLIPLYLRAVELAPNDAQLWASLAASYANLGQFEKAEEAARKVAEINPDSAPKIEEFLKSLPQ